MSHTSKRAKRADQNKISRAELEAGHERPALRLIALGVSHAFHYAAVARFGPRWWQRLAFTAKTRNRSPLGYALDVLLK